MRNKVSAISVLAAGLILAAGGNAAADDHSTVVTGGSDFSQAPVVVNEPQQGVLISNGSFVDGRCIAPWSNGAVAGGVVASNSHYSACNTDVVHQEQVGEYNGLL